MPLPIVSVAGVVPPLPRIQSIATACAHHDRTCAAEYLRALENQLIVNGPVGRPQVEPSIERQAVGHVDHEG